MITRQKALDILNAHIPNKNLLKHCLAVEAAMGGLHKHFNEPAKTLEKWKLAGLMHDADWEETRGDFNRHTQVTLQWLKEAGETDEDVFQTILAHNYNHNQHNPPKNNMEWSLYICDELTGLITACALVLPDKKLSSVTVESVLKKFPSKNFAAGVHRDQIKLCEEKLNIKLDEFVGIVLRSMQGISADLGL